MSFPANEEWFSTTIRRNRKSYIRANIILFVGFIISASLLFISGLGLIVLALVPLCYACQIFLSAQRLRDFDASGWLALLWIPATLADLFSLGAFGMVFFIVLCCVPGTKGENAYGLDPLEEAVTQ